MFAIGEAMYPRAWHQNGCRNPITKSFNIVVIECTRASDDGLILLEKNMRDFVSQRESHASLWTVCSKLNTWASFDPSCSTILSHTRSDNFGDSQGLGDPLEVYRNAGAG